MNVEAVANHIARWLDDYAATARVEGFVVGISGGIDSAVSSSLAALTGRPTLCVALPIHQHRAQIQCAAELIDTLRGRHHNVTDADSDLTAAYEAFAAALPVCNDDPERQNLNTANLRSRMRMAALYYYAGLRNALVVGTGNKIEDYGIGFFTKYGDGGVDINPIGDLTKSEVYELGRYLGVPESVLSACPTDGLFGDGRTDEQQIGASYPELEWAMEQAENGVPVEKFSGRQRDVYEIYLLRNRANRHKMAMPPVCMIPPGLKYKLVL